MSARLVGLFSSLLAVMGVLAAVVTVSARADAGSQSTAYQLDPAHDGYASGVSLAPPLAQASSQTLSASPIRLSSATRCT